MVWEAACRLHSHEPCISLTVPHENGQDTNDCDTGSDSNAWICPVSRTTVILRMVRTARSSTLGCRHITWLSSQLCEHSGRPCCSPLLLSACCALCSTVCEDLRICTDHQIDHLAQDTSKKRLHRIIIVMESRHMVAEPLIEHITSRTRQEEAWKNEVMDHTTEVLETGRHED